MHTQNVLESHEVKPFVPGQETKGKPEEGYYIFKVRESIYDEQKKISTWGPEATTGAKTSYEAASNYLAATRRSPTEHSSLDKFWLQVSNVVCGTVVFTVTPYKTVKYSLSMGG